MKSLFNNVINNANDNAVGTKNEHRANGNESDNLDANVVKTAAEVDETNNRKEINHIIEYDVEYVIIFVNVPIE